MIEVKTQFGTAMSADFEENTWTFLMPEKFEVRAGQFALVDRQLYDKMILAIENLNQAVDNYWNSDTKPDSLIKLINKQQQFCKDVLSKVANGSNIS